MSPESKALAAYYRMLERKMLEACQTGRDLAVSAVEWDGHIFKVRFAYLDPRADTYPYGKGWTIYYTSRVDPSRLLTAENASSRPLA